MEDKILATVEGTPIKKSQLDLLVDQLPQDQQAQFKGRDGQRKLLDEMIAQELFYLEGKKEKVEETEEFKKLLEETKEKLLKTHMIASFMKSVDIDEAEIKKYYDENPSQFIAPDSIRASHILLPAEQQAIDILEEIKLEKKSFEDAAKEYSVCPSKNAGGDLNYFSRGQMVPPFESAAFQLAVGEMTEAPVKTDFGWHIIKVTDIKTKETIPFEAVHDSLRNFLLGQKQNRKFLDRVEELKKEYTVELNLGI